MPAIKERMSRVNNLCTISFSDILHSVKLNAKLSRSIELGHLAHFAGLCLTL